VLGERVRIRVRVRVRVRVRETTRRGKGAHLRVEGERGDGVADVKHLMQRLGRRRREHAAATVEADRAWLGLRLGFRVRVRIRARARVRVRVRVGVRVGVREADRA
jgi:hypothetical protein